MRMHAHVVVSIDREGEKAGGGAACTWRTAQAYICVHELRRHASSEGGEAACAWRIAQTYTCTRATEHRASSDGSGWVGEASPGGTPASKKRSKIPPGIDQEMRE